MTGPEVPLPRVLLVCEWFVKYTVGLAAGLLENGCEVGLLTRDHDIEFGEEPGAMRAFVADRLGPRVRHWELGGRVREIGRLPEIRRLRGEVAAWGPDVVHAQDSITHDPRLALAGGWPWDRYALTVHDPVPHPGDLQPSRAASARRRYLRRHATLLFAHSVGMGAELRGLGDARGAVEVIPHGLEPTEPRPLPARPSLLFFGRIAHYKGLDTLLEAMPLVWDRRPDVTLTVAGNGTLPQLPALADERVTLRHEHVPEAAVPGLFEASTAVVLPYRQASQSGVGAEAKRFGRPAIVTDVGGLPELIDASSGRLVAPEDPAALAAAILEVVDTPGLAARLAAGAAASARAESWGAVGARTLAAYRRFLLS
jgi:glycosyltransferase involved in cell wall biosynthesis